MPKPVYAQAVDEIQNALSPLLKSHGFKVRGRTFNRITEDDLTEVINLQMGPFDPPGTTYIPGLRENRHGLFDVDLGVYVPEVAEQLGHRARSWVREYHCCVRARLGELCGQDREIWWHARANNSVIADVRKCIEEVGFPFLDRFSTRDKILDQWRDRSGNMGASNPPRIVMAIILAKRGQTRPATELLLRQAEETESAGHRDYVGKLAEELGLGTLDP